MQEFLIELISSNPYLVVGAVFVLCGVGLPLPEEIVLVVAGYSCFKESADLLPMMATCAVSIALGDLIPYLLGRQFGVKLLRLRPLRVAFTRERLARFDRWFRGRGDYVIFFARFIAGIRTVAFFTAGTMRMPYWRFFLLDGAGIALLVPTLVYAGYHFGGVLDEVIGFVQKVERSVLIVAAVAGVGFGIWYWLRRRRLSRELVGPRTQTYVEPKKPVRRERTRSDATDDGLAAAVHPNGAREDGPDAAENTEAEEDPETEGAEPGAADTETPTGESTTPDEPSVAGATTRRTGGGAEPARGRDDGNNDGS
jgi:membrane protein DedA with SNARE-associated domain